MVNEKKSVMMGSLVASVDFRKPQDREPKLRVFFQQCSFRRLCLETTPFNRVVFLFDVLVHFIIQARLAGAGSVLWGDFLLAYIHVHCRFK